MVARNIRLFELFSRFDVFYKLYANYKTANVKQNGHANYELT